MRILLLANAKSYHTRRWAVSLANSGKRVLLVSLDTPNKWIRELYTGNGVELRTLSIDTEHSRTTFTKIVYLKSVPQLRKLIVDFKPDIVHAHYATSYGLLGSLCGFHPFIVSAWGSDVMDFPLQSPLHRLLIRFNLRCADKLLATSESIADETRKYTDKKVTITPFGVDLEQFSPTPIESPFGEGAIVVGCLKPVEPVYGHTTLIRALSLARGMRPDLPLRGLFVGGGSHEQAARVLCHQVGVEESVLFMGERCPHRHPQYSFRICQTAVPFG